MHGFVDPSVGLIDAGVLPHELPSASVAGLSSAEVSQHISSSSEVFRTHSLRELQRVRTRDFITVESSCGGPASLYHVVNDQIPPELQDLLRRPLTAHEREQLSRRVDAISAEVVPIPHRPKALWIFGPPAVGKSSMADELSIDLFGRPNNAVLVDGDEVRLVHEGFQKVAEHGFRSNVVHADAWEIFKETKIVQEAKKDVFRAAIQKRQNLKLPDASTNTKRISAMISELERADYELYAICMWAPEAETQIRGRFRSVKAGKLFSTRNYLQACMGALEMGCLWERKIAEGCRCFKAVAFYDNTIRPSHPVHLAQFEQLVKMADSEAREHAERCRATRDAHQRADVAASEARARGSAPRAVAKLWLQEASRPANVGTESTSSQALTRSWSMSESLRGWTSADARAPSSSAAAPTTGPSCAEDLSSLFLAERRLGQAQGVLLGIALFCVVQASVRLTCGWR